MKLLLKQQQRVNRQAITTFFDLAYKFSHDEPGTLAVIVGLLLERNQSYLLSLAWTERLWFAPYLVLLSLKNWISMIL